MTISGTCVWEFRTTGDADNGGGYVPGSGTDYSQQDSAELVSTDLAMASGSVTLTSVSGGFTSAMVGNIIQITAGTNFDTSWYEIKTYADTNTITLDATAASTGSGSGGTGYIGGAMQNIQDVWWSVDDENVFLPGHKAWIKAGTYTYTETIASVQDGDPDNNKYMVVEGYNSSRGDNPAGDDRPLFSMGDYAFQGDNYWLIKNLRVTGVIAWLTRFDNGSWMVNCKIENTSGTAGRSAYYSAGGSALDCELSSTKGHAYLAAAADFSILFSYLHDSEDNGISCGSRDYGFIGFNIIDSCTDYGIRFAGGNHNIRVFNNTIYNCGVGIGQLGASEFGPHIFVNNTISDCTTGVDWIVEVRDNYWDYNNWYNNTTDTVNVTKGPNALNVNPNFTNAAGGDFSLQAGSGLIDTGFAIRLGVG